MHPSSLCSSKIVFSAFQSGSMLVAAAAKPRTPFACNGQARHPSHAIPQTRLLQPRAPLSGSLQQRLRACCSTTVLATTKVLLLAAWWSQLAVCAIELWPEGRACKHNRGLGIGILVGTLVMGWTLCVE